MMYNITCILIKFYSGVEGSEYGKMDHIGHFHTISAKSSVIGVTNGYKWRGKKHSLEGLNGPDKYDSMFVDLSKTGTNGTLV